MTTTEFEKVVTRAVEIVIDDGQDAYFWRVGGLPENGDLLPLLEARETQLFAAAQARGDVFDPLDFRWVRYEAKQFLVDNPNAKLLIELPAGDLLTAIENRKAAQETLLLKTLAMAVRYLYAQD
jgi:hypothetical protein